MNKSKTEEYAISLSDVTQIRGCIACEHYQGSRGIGYGGKWIFKKLSVSFPLSGLRHKCPIDGMYHIISSDDTSENGVVCKYFKSDLPNSYDNLPNTAVDITL